MSSQLFELAKKARNGNNDALLEILYAFKPAIKKFSRQLNYDCAEIDLTIFLIETLRKMNLSKLYMKNDQIIVGLIYKSLTNKKIDLFRKHVLNTKEQVELPSELVQEKPFEDLETKMVLKAALNSLSELQRNVLIKKYFNGYSDTEIASKLNISRQAVNRAKNRALEKLRELIAI